jgi:hypothetical protein
MLQSKIEGCKGTKTDNKKFGDSVHNQGKKFGDSIHNSEKKFGDSIKYVFLHPK